jgi:RHS repeat-associated protein
MTHHCGIVLLSTTVIDHRYDPAGNRTTKNVRVSSDTTRNYYVRDAQGNVLAIYTKKNTDTLKWNEQHLYGNLRLGMWQWDTIVPATAPVVISGPIYDSVLLGSRTYELNNHLGNVLATISDKKTGHDSSSTVNYYIAEVLSQNDYYPGGMPIQGRKYGTLGRHGFNGKEQNPEINGEGNSYDFGARIYDPRIGRWFSPDRDYKAAWSPYSSFYNNPNIVIDPDGNNEIVVIDTKSKTITIYQPVLYNGKQNDIMAKSGATMKDLEAAANKKWEDSEHKKVMVKVSNGVAEEYTMTFKTIIIEAKDDQEYASKEKEFRDLGIAYTSMELKPNYGQSDYQKYGLEGHLNLTSSNRDVPYDIEMLTFMFTHEAFGHGSGLSHSLGVIDIEIVLPNGRKTLVNNPAKSGISSYNRDNSFQQWEIQAIADGLIKSINGKLSNKSGVFYYNILADGENVIRNDAIISTEALKKDKQKEFIQKLIQPREAGTNQETKKERK